jgi:hypothetical protein
MGGVRFAEVESLALLRAVLDDCDADDVVCAYPPGSVVLDRVGVGEVFAALDVPVLLAAAPAGPGAEVLPLDVPTPYRCVGPALIGRVDALRRLPATDVDGLAKSYLAGEDLDLDIGAEVFLVRDGTHTDAMHLGGEIVATATGTRPVVIIGRVDDVRPPVFDELALMLGYRIPPRPGSEVTEAAPEILVTPFWTLDMCDLVMRAAEAAGSWGSDVDDPVPGFEVSLATISPRLFAHVEEDLERRIVPRWRTVWPEFAWNGLHDAFVIKYAAGEYGDLPLHHDVAQISVAVRLNAGYEGGALEFPRQRWANDGVDVGDLVAWPSLVTHPHRSRPVTRGVKYSLTIWTRLPV